MDTYLETSSTKVSWKWEENIIRRLLEKDYWSLKVASDIQITNWVNAGWLHSQLEDWKDAVKLSKVRIYWRH